MAFAFVAHTSASGTSVTSVNGTIPAGVQAGDLLVAMAVKSSTTGALTTPTGWGVARDEFVQTTNFEGEVYSKTADAADTPGSTVTFAITTTANVHVIVMAFRGARPGGTLRGTAQVDDGAAVTSHPIDASGITTDAGAVALYLAIHQTSATDWTSPSGFTEIADLYAVNLGITAHYDIRDAAGALGTLTATSAGARRAGLVALAFDEAAPAIQHRPKDATIRIRTLDQWETVGTDRARGIVHENLEYEHDAWGSLNASFDLRRSPRTPWPDISAYTDVEIEINAVTTWKGRVKGTPTRDGEDRSMNVQCEGLQAHLDDDTYVPVYVHTRLPDYRDARTFPAADLTKFRQNGNIQADGTILIGWPNGAALATNDAVGVILDLGPAATGKRATLAYDFTGGIGNSSFFIRAHPTPNPLVGFVNATTFGLGAGSGSGQASGTFSTAGRYVSLLIIYTGGATTLTADLTLRVSSCLVATDTAYESGDASNLKASTVITDALTKATVLLDPDRSLIATTAFNIPELASPSEDKTPREVWSAVNAFHNYASKIDERGRPVFQPLPSAPLIEVGEWAALDGSDASQNSGQDIYNRGVLSGQTPAGILARFEDLQSDNNLTKHAVQLNNPSADADVLNWTTDSPSGITRDTGTFDTTPASFRLLSMPFKTIATGTVAAGTFEKHRTYVLELRWRPDANHSFPTPDPDSWADGASCQFQFGTATDYGKLTLLGWTSAGTWTTLRVVWSPTATVSSGVEFRYLQGRYGTNSLRLDSFTIYRADSTLIDRRGFRRTKRLQITSPIPTDGVAAQQILDAYLASHRLAQFQGEYLITGPVREILTGKHVPPEQLGMRTTELLRFTDRIDPDTGAVGRDGRIARVRYTHATDEASVTIDTGTRNFEALLARLGALSGAGR